MKLVTGQTLWSIKNPVFKQYPYLIENIKCEVLIIGAGISGAICAFDFSESGVDTVVIDRSIIGYGSTRASTSILQYEIDQDMTGLSGIIGEDNAAKAFHLVYDSIDELESIINTIGNPGDCDFRRTKCLYYTTDKCLRNTMKKEYDLRKKHGFNVEFIDKSKGSMHYDFPIDSAVFSYDGAADIDPYRFTHKAFEYLSQKGTRIYENTEMVDMINCENGIIVKTKNGFDIKAKKVIIATGYNARDMLSKSLGSFTRSFCIVTNANLDFDGWYDGTIIRDANNPYNYIRSTSDNRIIMGGEDLAIGGVDSRIANLSNEDSLSNEKYKLINNRLNYMFPSAGGIDVEYGFSGYFADTKDGLPYIGTHKDYPNCYFCMGYGSNGILYSTIGGRVIRDMYFGEEKEYFRLLSLER